MNNYNPNIHHRRSIRLKGYDYSQAGLYFVTICVNNRKCLFGEIVGVQNFEPIRLPNESVSSDGIQNFEPRPRYQMILNDAGKIAGECWLEIPKHFQNAVLHEYIIMPNHIHGIIELIQTVSSPNESTSPVGVQNFEPQRNQFQKIIPHSIGSIIRGYKIGVTKWFRHNSDIENVWQRNYYEQIIHDETSHQRIADYIQNNPQSWDNDKFYES